MGINSRVALYTKIEKVECKNCVQEQNSRFDFVRFFYILLSRPDGANSSKIRYTCPDGGMVYTEVSKSSASRLAGSSPALGTRYTENTDKNEKVVSEILHPNLHRLCQSKELKHQQKKMK